MKEPKNLVDVLKYQYCFIGDIKLTTDLFLKANNKWGLLWSLMEVATYWYLQGIKAERNYRKTGVKEWHPNRQKKPY